MSKRKKIENMSYEELEAKRNRLLFERFVGIILLIALLLGGLVLMMIRDISLIDVDFMDEFVRWSLSAYGLIALGALGIIQIFVSTIDQARVLSYMKSRMDNDAGDKY